MNTFLKEAKTAFEAMSREESTHSQAVNKDYTK